MKIKAILFDLDGTLLPMDLDLFIKSYFDRLSLFLEKYGYNGEKILNSALEAIDDMYKNSGKMTNEEVFFQRIKNTSELSIEEIKEIFNKFYKDEFPFLKAACGFNKEAQETVSFLKESGYTIILATNPLFPFQATAQRISWSGVDINNFSYITTYENSHYSKPSLNYYKEILHKFNFKPNECIMVGNDADEDMAAENLGISTFLLDEYLINQKNKDISKYIHGNFKDLVNFIKTLR